MPPRPVPQDRKPKKPRGPKSPPPEAAVIQAAAEGAELPDGQIEFKGHTYKISDKVGIWPLMQFARAAEAGINVLDYRALAALHGFLQDCIAPEDWGRFQEDMISAKIDDADALLDVATTVVQKVTSRPTQPQSGSSNGQPGASDGLTAVPSSPAVPG